MKIILSLLLCFSMFAIQAQQLESTATLRSASNYTCRVFLDKDNDSLSITLTGPTNKYVALGFSAIRMNNNPYTVFSFGNGNFHERKLGNRSAGSQLSSTLNVVHHSQSSGIDSIVLSRGSLNGNDGNYFDFNTINESTTLDVIWGVGNSSSLVQHASRGRSSLTFVALCDDSPLTDLGDTTICEGQSLVFGGQTITSAGTYQNTLTNVDGCDSVIQIQVTVTPPPLTELGELRICQGESAVIFGLSRNQSGSYYDTVSTAAGCDSILQQDLAFFPSHFTELDTVYFCEGDSVEVFNEFRHAPGTYLDTLSDVNSCDSFLAIVVEQIPLMNPDTFELFLCDGDSVMVYGEWRNSSGLFSDTNTNVLGCDSISFTDLEVAPFIPGVALDAFICDGDSIEFNGRFLSEQGNYLDTLQSQFGCDSIIELFVFVTPVYDLIFTQQACEGDTVFIEDTIITNSGSYVFEYATGFNCDSTIQWDIDFVPAPALDLQLNADSFTLSGFGSEGIVEWFDCAAPNTILRIDSLTANFEMDVFVGETGNSYAARLTGAAGCVFETPCIEVVTSRLADFDLAHTVTIYPNPTAGEFRLSMAELHPTITVLVFNSQGQMMHMHQEFDNKELIMDLKHLPSGAYTVQVNIGEHQSSMPLLIQQ